MSTMNIYDLADTWNNGATTFSAIKMDVTDTASASPSLLMDLQVGGSSKFSVRKDGAAYLSAIGNLGGGAHVFFGNSGYYTFRLGSGTGFRGASTTEFSWSSTDDGLGTKDLILARDAANTLAQRNSTNAQAFRAYKSYTDASNYERFVVDTTSSAILLTYDFAGTGISRNVVLRSPSDVFYDGNNHTFRNTVSGGSVTRWAINTSGHFLAGADNTYDIGAATATRPRNFFQAGYWQTSEMTAPAAPAANGVRIYAEDDGAGKTRLMALFASGVAQQIAIEP